MGPRRGGNRFSIQWKLLVAFLAAGVLPMLGSAYLAAKLVSYTFESNIEKWLRETSGFFVSDMLETRKDALALGEFLLSRNNVIDAVVHGGHDEHFTRLLEGMGFGLMALYDGDRKLLYTSVPIKSIEPLAMKGDDATLYRVEMGEKTMVMGAGMTAIERPEGRFYLLLGTWLDENYINHLNGITSLDLRIYYRNGERFEEFYSSRGSGKLQSLPEAVMRMLGAGAESFYDPKAENSRYRALYTPLRNSEGKLTGAVFCGLKVKDALAAVVSKQNLFATIFLFGTTLAALAAAFLARRLAGPLRSLAGAVRAVAAGDFRQEVAVQGHDEVAELASAFNHMAARLSQLHELEAQLRRQERLSAMGEMAAGIAHEIRNPLGIIKTSAQIVKKKATGEQEGQLLEYVVEQVSRIDELITGFLAFAKPSPPALTAHKLADIIDGVARFCEPELTRHNIAIRVEPKHPDASILCDDNQIFQACLNLIINSQEALKDGGTLTISWERVGSKVCVRFSDNGPGIPPDIQEKIFNPFFTTKVKGSGLGLAKVFSIMEAHHGHVECKSTLGKGATFTLIFPLERD